LYSSVAGYEDNFIFSKRQMNKNSCKKKENLYIQYGVLIIYKVFPNGEGKGKKG